MEGGLLRRFEAAKAIAALRETLWGVVAEVEKQKRWLSGSSAMANSQPLPYLIYTRLSHVSLHPDFFSGERR